MEAKGHPLAESQSLATAGPYCVYDPEIATSAQGSPDRRSAHADCGLGS